MRSGLIAGTHLICFWFCVYYFANAQTTDFSDKIAGWKSRFPKEDVIAAQYKKIITFFLNTSTTTNEPKVKASVSTEITLVPLKDFVKFQDGIFYYQDVSLDSVRAINSKGKEILVQKLCGSYQQEDIFYDDSKLCSIRFPLEEKGKACRYSYRENFKDVKYFTSVYFNGIIPVVEKIIEYDIPSWLEIGLHEFNFTGSSIEKNSVKENDMTKIIYSIKDVPAYKDEPNSPNHALSYPHIICVSKAYIVNGQRNVLFESVKDLYTWYRTVCDSIGNNPNDLKERVNALTAGKKTDAEKIESIFYWVQDNIRYIAFENGIMGFRPDAAQNVLKKKYGDCKGKANLLKEMLKLAGYDARLTWIGTSDLPYDYSLPSLSVDNHMICTVILNGKRYFLDGTEGYIALNDYAQRLQGKQVLIEDGNNFILDHIPSFSAERNKVKRIITMSIDGTTLKGHGNIEFNGEAKIMAQSIYASVRNENKSDAFSSFLRKSNDNVVVVAIKYPDFSDRQKSILVNYDFKTDHQVTQAGNEIYVVMDWDKEFSNFEFDNDRKNDYELNYKYYLVIQTELAIPDGYKVDYLPSAFRKTTTDYSFEGSYINKGKSIVYNKTIVINKPILKKSDFSDWNAFIRDINKFYNDQVVLIK